MVLYFSATGNSLYVSKKLNDVAYSIPQLIKQNKFEFEDEEIGIVFPSFYNAVPKLIEDFLNKAKFKSNYIYGIVTYGLMCGDTTSHLNQIGKRNNIHFNYINNISMYSNYLPMFDMQTHLDKNNEIAITDKLDQITKDILKKRNYIYKTSPLYKPIRLVSTFLHRNNSDADFSIDDKCNGCTICAKVCPVDNIEVVNQPIFKSNCQQCLACIQNCPQKALHIKKEKSDVRFINPNISLNELIDANK